MEIALSKIKKCKFRMEIGLSEIKKGNFRMEIACLKNYNGNFRSENVLRLTSSLKISHIYNCLMHSIL